jgi:hypothetical protein
MIKKPTLLLCPGTAYSATSPLYYTLSCDHGYCHGGYDKEYKFLRMLYYSKVNHSDYETEYNTDFRRMFDPKIKDGNIKMVGGMRTRHPKVFYNNSHTNFTEDQKKYFYSSPHTIEKYIDYYKQHYDNIKQEYQAVSDFSTCNGNLPLWFLQEISPQLKEHFDVKVIIVFRDPVRRLFSEVNKRYYLWENIEFISASELMLNILNNPTGNLYGLHAQYENPNILTYYSDIIKNYTSCFENVHMVSMEDLWDHPSETERLSDFLSYKITAMHQNVYWPPMGTKAPRYEYLADQWMSDQEDLLDGVKKKARVLMNSVYTEWNDISKHWTPTL